MMRRIFHWLYRRCTLQSMQPGAERWRKWRAWLWLQLATTFRRNKTKCQT